MSKPSWQVIEAMFLKGDDLWVDDTDFGLYNIHGDENPPTLKCAHMWHPTVLISSTVYDCKKCGIKKEDIDTLK